VAWQEARQQMLRRFGDPDASKAVQNLGITILALLYGAGDFGRTQLVALNCGYDTDCTCATAGALLGIIHGAGKIPEEWKYQAEDTFVVGIDVQRPTDKISDLATDTCRVGVAVAQVLNGAAAIVDVPPGLGFERINTAPPSMPIAVTVDYLGKPEIAPGAPKQVQVWVHNRSGERRAGCLQLAAEGCVISPSTAALDLGAGAAQGVLVTVELRPEVAEYGAGLTVTVSWEEAGRCVLQERVGLAVAQPWTVFGPFWDLYDTREQGAESFWNPVDRRKARPRGAENFNNYVNLARAYVDEDALAGGTPVNAEGRTCYAAEHKLPIDEWLETAGPACLYLAQELVAPEARNVRLMVGNSDGFRIWVNGEVVGESSDPWYWMPYNHDITVSLRAGSNRVVVKLIRRGKSCEFSLGYAVPKTHVRWFNDLKTREAR
jgi:hypothetical protein